MAVLEIRLRATEDRDMPFLEELYASTRAEEVAAFGWPLELQKSFLKQQFSAQDSDHRARRPQARRLIVEQGGARIGRLYLDEEAEAVRVIDISLLPKNRGNGLGSAILKGVIDDAVARGKGVRLRVIQGNRAARLYERLGFVKSGGEGAYEAMELLPPVAVNA